MAPNEHQGHRNSSVAGFSWISKFKVPGGFTAFGRVFQESLDEGLWVREKIGNSSKNARTPTPRVEEAENKYSERGLPVLYELRWLNCGFNEVEANVYGV